MEIVPLSDIHLEFGTYQVKRTNRSKNQILALAGDIGLVHRKPKLREYLAFLKDCSEQFYEVLLVMGNHEHYQGSLLRTRVKLQEGIDSLGLFNVHLLDNTMREYPEKKIVVLGSTLWTDGDSDHPLSPFYWEKMSDLKRIRTGTLAEPYRDRFKFYYMVREFRFSWHFLRENTKKYKDLGWRIIWLNHHAISSLSIPDRFIGDTLNRFFTSPSKEYELLDLSPDLTIHGHLHNSVDYRIGDTRVVCNPRGYYGYSLNPDFNESLVINIE